MPPEGLDRPPKLVRDVQLVSVEKQQYPVHAFGKPFQNPDEIVTPINSLLLTAECKKEGKFYIQCG